MTTTTTTANTARTTFTVLQACREYNVSDVTIKRHIALGNLHPESRLNQKKRPRWHIDAEELSALAQQMGWKKRHAA